MKRKGGLIAILIIAVIGVSVYVGFPHLPVLPVQYELNINSTTGGNVTVPGEGTFNYSNSTVINLTATPDTNYTFVNWAGDVDSIRDVNSSATNVTINGNYSIIANFAEIPKPQIPKQYSLIIGSTEGGNVTTPGEGRFTYNQSEVVKLEATPDSGYGFVNWTGDVAKITNVSAASITITMYGDYSVTANFTKKSGGSGGGSGGGGGGAPQPKICKLYGLNFGPYVKEGQNPDKGTYIPEEQIRDLMTTIAPYTDWGKTFGCRNGLEVTGRVAHEQGLKIAVGAWLSSNLSANEEEISSLINIGQAGEADMLIVGSETLYRGDLTEAQLIAYINQVKEAVPGIPVATADTYGKLLDHPDVMAAGDVILANFYPLWEGIDVNQSIADLHAKYQEVVAAAGGKKVYVAETGWPSEGEPIGSAVPSPENAAFYFQNFVSWAEAQGVDYFYFEAFDEPWKAIKEGSRGAHWGVWDKDGKLKPGMAEVFNCTRIPNNWNNPPIADAGPDKEVNESESVILNGSGSYDPDGDPITFSWSCSGGTLSDPSIAQPTFTSPEVSADTTFSCALTVSDGELNDTDSVSILVKDVPEEPGEPTIWFTYVPPYGSFNNLEGQVENVTPANYKVAVYIKVEGFWWTKPYWTSPSTVIKPNGSWTCDITTGGQDETATEIVAYLVPNEYNPPLMGCNPTPPMACSSMIPAELEANAVAKVGVTRSH